MKLKYITKLNSSIAIFLIFTLPGSAVARLSIIKSLYVDDFEAITESSAQESFKLDGEFGFLTSSGNTNSTSVKAAFDAEHEMKSWSNRYRFETFYRRNTNQQEANKVVSAQRLYANAQMDFKLGDPNKRLFLFGEYDNNRFSAYDYQGAIAAGWAQKTIDTTDYQLRYSLGPGYGFAIKHDGHSDQQKHGLIFRASVEYKQKLSTGAKLRQFISTEANDYATRSRSETSISAKVIGAMAMKLSFIMNYNSGAEDTQDNLDTETSVTLVYQFF